MNKDEFVKLFGTPFTLRVLYDIYTHPETTKYGILNRATYNNYYAKQRVKHVIHELNERGLIKGFTCYTVNLDHPIMNCYAQLFSHIEPSLVS